MAATGQDLMAADTASAGTSSLQPHAGLWEPYDGRLSRTVLTELEGEVPSRHSPGRGGRWRDITIRPPDEATAARLAAAAVCGALSEAGLLRRGGRCPGTANGACTVAAVTCRSGGEAP